MPFFLPRHPEGLATMRRSGREGHWKMNGCKTGEAMSTGSSNALDLALATVLVNAGFGAHLDGCPKAELHQTPSS